MGGLAHHRPQVVPHGSVRLTLQVLAQGRQGAPCQDPQQPTHQRQRPKRRMPAQCVGQPQPQWHPRHRGQRKRRHDNAHGRTPTLKGHHIGHDGLRQGGQDPPKHPSGHPGQQQGVVAGRHSAGQGGQRKQGVEHQQQALAVKAVHIQRGGQPRHTGRQGVGRDQQAERGVVDAKDARELRPQRHHDHEIENVGELHTCEGQQKPAFAARVKGGL